MPIQKIVYRARAQISSHCLQDVNVDSFDRLSVNPTNFMVAYYYKL